MTTNSLFTLLSGTGAATVVAALIAWVRGRKKDGADVAAAWTDLTATALSGAQAQVASLNQDVEALRTAVRDARHQVQEIASIAGSVIEELEKHDAAKGEYFRNRLRLMS